ncbi:uncharacterized protein LOC123499517 isoform X3 [Portunus trituberculatus]|uniref:uncharacterized protein LOC123499517 isoform X3 n=1 Tax=Portunus trituberculatus TaxID=210409 RepID=UPI001E1CE9F8|nr:uncharacterized protein LOC123499517 isoform X3 [Portunus trituberculatus]
MGLGTLGNIQTSTPRVPDGRQDRSLVTQPSSTHTGSQRCVTWPGMAPVVTPAGERIPFISSSPPERSSPSQSCLARNVLFPQCSVYNKGEGRVMPVTP